MAQYDSARGAARIVIPAHPAARARVAEDPAGAVTLEQAIRFVLADDGSLGQSYAGFV